MSDLRNSAQASEESTLLVDVLATDVLATDVVALQDSTIVAVLDRASSDRLDPATAGTLLTDLIADEVRLATRGGVRDLEVRITAEDIRLLGRCSTFYCKQLAQHAAKHLTGGVRLYNEIEVW